MQGEYYNITKLFNNETWYDAFLFLQGRPSEIGAAQGGLHRVGRVVR